jgi:uncharacterized membrane protein YcaP (DUF421 family)
LPIIFFISSNENASSMSALRSKPDILQHGFHVR